MNVGKEPGENWTPLEALGVALRAVDEVESDLRRELFSPRTTARDAVSDYLMKVKSALAEQFVQEGVGGLKS